jgi:rhamnose transport system substrate-binding protein
LLRRILLAGVGTALVAGFSGCGKSEPDKPARTRVGLVAKSLGNGFFDAVHKGADEAAKELDVEVIFTGPTTPTAEGQIEVLNALIAQRVDAIAVSANDPDALVPTLKRAMERGIKVISYDSGVAAAGRIVHLAPSSDQLIGETVVALTAELAPEGKGSFAVVSATPTSTNQNSWLAEMRKALPQHAGLTGKVKVTGLGLPSELAGYVEKGVVPKFAIWNPIDLGYATTQVAVRLARNGNVAKPVSIGRMGEVTFGADGVGAMSKPFIYDAGNVAEFARIF